eukprot:scaffold7176_cov145-Amphora_coffeaeformis.AAC.3
MSDFLPLGPVRQVESVPHSTEYRAAVIAWAECQRMTKNDLHFTRDSNNDQTILKETGQLEGPEIVVDLR